MKKKSSRNELFLRELLRAPKKNKRVLELIALTNKEGLGNLCSEPSLLRAPSARVQLEKCILLEFTNGDFYSPFTDTVHRAMKRVVPRGDIVEAYCNGTLDEMYYSWKLARVERREKARARKEKKLRGVGTGSISSSIFKKIFQ